MRMRSLEQKDAQKEFDEEDGEESEFNIAGDANAIVMNGVHVVRVASLRRVFGSLGLMRARLVVHILLTRISGLGWRVIWVSFVISSAAVLLVTAAALGGGRGAAAVIKILVVVMFVVSSIALAGIVLAGVVVISTSGVVHVVGPAAPVLGVADSARVEDVVFSGTRSLGGFGDLSRHRTSGHVLFDPQKLFQDGGDDL